MKKLLAIAFSLCSLLVLSQPANDNCATAQAIGSLPTPSGCPSGTGANVVVAGTLNGATAANPYTYQGTGCTGSSSTMAAPAIDVWYTFVATGYQLNLSIAGSVANPNVAVYSGNCSALGGGVGGCSVGNGGGSGTLTVQQMVIGQTYYMQVSGNSATATGTFTLTMNNSIDCNNCLGGSNLTVTPPPTNGMYAPGTTVNFCFKVNSYTQVNTNWLHGVQLAFGAGWNLGSLTANPPPSCQGTGYWAYYAGGITDNSGQAWPSGFYFETVNGQNNPGNNFGDNCSGNINAANWNFCFSITTAAACNPGSNLSVAINTSGDGESGSWSSLGCVGDPATNFNAIGACCPPTMASTSVSCNGGNNGTATATPVGTQSPFTYTWSPAGGNSATATNLPAGTYTVSVVDKNNCLATNTVTVIQPTPLTLTLTPTNATCGSSNGSITASAGGGTPAYTYQINTGGYSGTSTFPGLSAGTYTVDVRDNNGCIRTATVSITSSPNPTVTVNSGTTCNNGSVTLTANGATTYSWTPATGLSATTGASVTASPTTTTVYTITGTTGGCSGTATTTVTIVSNPTVTVNTATICVGQQTATLTANGATTYSWSPGTGLSGTSGTTVTANPGATTVYTITGTAGSCTAVATTTVTVNPLPLVTVNSGTICIGQTTATLTANGASTYTWSPSTGLSSSNGSPVTANPGATTSYTVSGTNGNGCINSATTSVIVNPLPNVTVNNGTVCNGTSVTLTANGASTYSWNPGTGLSATTGASVTANPTVTTNYTVTGTDVNGCVNTATTIVTVVSNPTVTINTATICAGQQTATLTANGASTYNWNPGTGLSSTTGSTVTANPGATTVYTITGTAGSCTAVATTTVTVNTPPVVTVNSATICVGQQTATLTANGATTYTWTPGIGLSATNGSPVTANPGSTTTYTIDGTDANGCTGSANATVLVNPLPIITVNNGLICSGGSLTLNANGATTYSWSPGTGLSATTGSSVNANPATTTQYTVVGIDANGCINGDTTTVTVVNNPTVTVTSGTICVGQQTATLTANGASTYTWVPGTGLSATTGSLVTANPGATTTYTITGTVGTCTATGNATVTVNPLPIVTASSATICVGQQTATLTANGANTYSWNPSGSLCCTTGATVTGTPTVSTNYTITGTDANGCVNTATASILVNPLPNVTVNSGLICAGNSMTLNANGAATYAWSPPGGLSATTGANVNASPVATTIYTVTGTDANGCVSSASSTVTVANNPTVTVSTGTICMGQGTTTLTANGAATYAWSPATGLSSTTGSVVTANPNTTTVYTITGTLGTCTAAATTTVTVNPLPNIVAGSNSPVCVNQTLNLTSANGVGYSWSGPNGFNSLTQNPTITGVTVAQGGVYTVTGVDANSCVNTATVSVIINPLPVVTATGATVCTNQTINLSCTPNGASGYSWSGPMLYSSNVQNPVITGANANMAGNYVVTVTDGNGCVNANVAQVVVNSLPVVSVNSGEICAGQTTATLTATGANTYAWAPTTGLSAASGATVVASPASTSSYTVTGTDINGCQNTSTLTVLVNPVPSLSISPQMASGCAPVCTSFSNTTSSSGNCNWNFGDGSSGQNCNPNHCFTVQGSYNITLTLTDSNGCVNSATAGVTVYPVPFADFNVSPQPTTILEPTIQFYDASGGANITTWNWNFGDNSNTNTSTLQSPGHVYGDTGSYAVQLLVISNQGCRDSVIKIVRIDDDFALYVPNAFSPNSDGVNDIFKAVGIGVKEFRLYIFDRWGNQVFYSEDIDKGWDGRFQSKGEDIVQEDVYVWKIECKTVKKDKRQLSGIVSLLK